MKKLFLLLLMVATIGVAVAQTRTVSGKVTYEADGEPLAGVTIMPIGGGQGIATDAHGEFTLSVPASVQKIRVSYIGMHTQEVAVGQNLKIQLVSNDKRLDDVIVVAYGTAKRSAYTGSAAVVDAEKIENAVVTNALNALTGNVPGVQLTQENGQPGVAPTVRIRGIGSLNASSAPLYVVDGMPYEGNISQLNPADIESMTVLKDAAAAALYGARGANGVILVTTKKGRDGAAKVSVDARWGVNSRQIPNYATISSPEQYYELAYQAIYNSNIATGYPADKAHQMANAKLQDPAQSVFGPGYLMFTTPVGQDLIGTNGKLNPNSTLGWSDGRNYFTPDNWADNTFENGFRQEYNVSVQGGTDRFNYYISGGFLGDEGVIIGSDYNRMSTRATIDYQAKSWLKVGTNMSYNHVSNGYPSDQTSDNSGGNAFLMANQIAPVYPMFIRDANGVIMTDANTGNPIYDYGDGKYSVANRTFYGKSNAVSDLIYSNTEYFYDVFQGKWYATVTPVENLNVTANLGYYLNNGRTHVRTSKLYGQMAAYGGSNDVAMDRDSGVNFQVLATYNHTIADKHSLDYLVGYESYERNWESLSGTGRNLYDPYDWTLNNTLLNGERQAFSSAGKYSTRGILARVNYDFDSKYYVSGSYRRDASSRFAPENRWGDFFSVSAAWDIAKESFMHDASAWLDQLKLKASFGQQGNDNLLNYYPYLDQYSISGYDAWSDGILAYKGNRDITWEKSDTWNAGIDFGIKQGLVSGTIEYFRRTVNDMLYYKPVPPSNGYSEYPMNVGSMRNQGVEVEVNVRPISTKDWTWELNGNVTYLDSKILSLEPTYDDTKQYGRVLIAGGPFYQMNMVQYGGVDNRKTVWMDGVESANPNLGGPLYWAYGDVRDDQGKKIQIGTELVDGEEVPIYKQGEYLTESWDVARATNLKLTGSLMPKVYGGFGTSLRYKGLDLGVQFSFQLGGKVYDNAYIDGLNSGKQDFMGRNWSADIVNAWTPENTNTNIPKLNYTASYGIDNMTNFGLVSSDYLALNNLTVGYTLPNTLVGRLGMESVRIYFAGENLALWSKRKGLDPRNNYAGGLESNVRYSPIRNLSGGLRVVF